MIQNERVLKFILDSMTYPGFWEVLNRVPIRDALPVTTLNELHWRTLQQPLLNERNSGFGRTYMVENHI